MLDEYKVSDQFWAEAINTACHAINRLYLHKILNKTTYELLLGKMPNVSYFRVFWSKCFILNKKNKTSNFAPKVDEGFLLGYASNAHGYRVFNKTSDCVEIACDVTFDESNGSQGEQVDDVVGLEESSSKAIKMLAIGEIKPQEKRIKMRIGWCFQVHQEHIPQRIPETPEIKPETPGLKSGLTGKRTGVFGTWIKNHHPIIKINLKMKKRLNKFNNKHKFLIQEYIKVSKRIIRWTTSLEA